MMPTDEEVYEAAMALAELATAPGCKLEPSLWFIPAMRALQAVERLRERKEADESDRVNFNRRRPR